MPRYPPGGPVVHGGDQSVGLYLSADFRSADGAERGLKHFVGQTRSGEEVVVVRKGWSVDRGQVITQMDRRGVMGDVWVYYFDGSNLERKIRCGI